MHVENTIQSLEIALERTENNRTKRLQNRLLQILRELHMHALPEDEKKELEQILEGCLPDIESFAWQEYSAMKTLLDQFLRELNARLGYSLRWGHQLIWGGLGVFCGSLLSLAGLFLPIPYANYAIAGLGILGWLVGLIREKRDQRRGKILKAKAFFIC
jgi:hypothetical protein